MNKPLKKVLIISASVLMFLSAGAGINNVNAKKYHYRYRTHRIVRHHNKRTRHNKKRAKRIKRAKVSLKNKYGYYKRGIYHRYKTGYYRHGHWVKYRRTHKVHKAKKFAKMQRKNKSISTKATKRIANKLAKALKYAPKGVANLPLSASQISDMQKQSKSSDNALSYPNEKGAIVYHLFKGDSPKNAAIEANTAYEGVAKPTEELGLTTVHGTSATDPSDHTPEQVKENMENEIKSRTLYDLSQDRASVNEQPQQECSDLDTTAKERSRELVNKFSHENSNGQYASDEDGNIDSENIAFETEPSGANNDDIAVGAANDLNKMLFYDEEPSDGGHYEDIKDHDQVGVGATIANGNVYLAEDFAE